MCRWGEGRACCLLVAAASEVVKVRLAHRSSRRRGVRKRDVSDIAALLR